MIQRGRSFVADLIAKSPLFGQGPVRHGALTLAEGAPQRLTSVMPRDMVGLEGALKPMGLRFPAPNRAEGDAEVRLIWTGRNQAFLIGADPAPLAPFAALTDQSDGWARLVLSGEGALEVLARVTPLDPRDLHPGASLRSSLGHMAAIFLPGPGGVEIMVFRSMAKTAWHELETALKSLAAREALHADK
jgi:sarcosine oxidase gamma subunit